MTDIAKPCTTCELLLEPTDRRRYPAMSEHGNDIDWAEKLIALVKLAKFSGRTSGVLVAQNGDLYSAAIGPMQSSSTTIPEAVDKLWLVMTGPPTDGRPRAALDWGSGLYHVEWDGDHWIGPEPGV